MKQSLEKNTLMIALITGSVIWGGTSGYAEEPEQVFTLDPMIVTATRTEKRDDLRAFFVSMEDAKELLKEYNKDNPKAAYLAVETIKVLDEYEKLEIK